jgi:hypothetical protein
MSHFFYIWRPSSSTSVDFCGEMLSELRISELDVNMEISQYILVLALGRAQVRPSFMASESTEALKLNEYSLI